LGNSLDDLLAEGVISEIITRLKSGKEADVYAVRQGGKVIAAKVYKDRAHRSFKNNSAYKEGRQVRSSRSQRAMDRGSKFGKEAAEDAWKSAEANTLYTLHAAGVRVPTPVMFLEGVLFMELVLAANGQVAPRLIDTQLSVEDAHDAYRDMLAQLVRILCCDLIHGDLSPYNVLWAESGPTIIDFPQVVSASHNSSSEAFFMRDARNILGHFAQIDSRLRARASDPAEIWRAYMRRELSPDFLPTGRASRPEPRRDFQPAARASRPEPRPRVELPPPANRGQAPRPAPAVDGPRTPARAQSPNAQQQRGPSRPHEPRNSAQSVSSGGHGRNGQGPRSGASSHKSPGSPPHARSAGRRPEVIVLTRRSPKPASDVASAGLGREHRVSTPGSTPERSANPERDPAGSSRAQSDLRAHPSTPAAEAQGAAPSKRRRRRRRRARTPES
jgi:RIO kinase 1